MDKKTMKNELWLILSTINSTTGLEDEDEALLQYAYEAVGKLIESLAEQPENQLDDINVADIPAQQQVIDWKDQYEKQKRRAEMWIAKYEADIGPLEKAGPVTAQQQEPAAWFELLREARDNCKASIVEEGISASRKKYRIDLEARLTAALNTSPPASKPLTDEQIA